mmetsp:Transcript_37686/g.118951  ORF Transcript_37686/g.118951 Transcript_37686/m.118951 type:complete len:306 (-) Transcript_37686:3063-3980(-)
MAEGLGIKPGALVRGLNIVAGAQHQVVAITRDIIRDADNLSLLIHEILPPAHLYELLHLHRGRGGGHHVGLVEHEGGSGGEEGAIGVAEVLVVHLTIHDGAGLVGVHGVEVALGIRLRHHALRERGLGEANTLHGHLDTAINRVGVASRATGHLHHVRRSPWDTGVDVLGVRREGGFVVVVDFGLNERDSVDAIPEDGAVPITLVGIVRRLLAHEASGEVLKNVFVGVDGGGAIRSDEARGPPRVVRNTRAAGVEVVCVCLVALGLGDRIKLGEAALGGTGIGGDGGGGGRRQGPLHARVVEAGP